jgi:hypothetical protein
MMRSKIAGIAAAIALTFVSTAAVAAPAASAASKLSVSKNMRTSANLQRANNAGGFPFLIVFVVIAAGLGLYFAVADGGDDRPTSP